MVVVYATNGVRNGFSLNRFFTYLISGTIQSFATRHHNIEFYLMISVINKACEPCVYLLPTSLMYVTACMCWEQTDVTGSWVKIKSNYTAINEDEISVTDRDTVQILSVNGHMAMVHRPANGQSPDAEGFVPASVVHPNIPNSENFITYV